MYALNLFHDIIDNLIDNPIVKIISNPIQAYAPNKTKRFKTGFGFLIF